MLRKGIVIGYVICSVLFLPGNLNFCVSVADEPQSERSEETQRSATSDSDSVDLFARLRTTQFRASEAYWRQFGEALSRMGTLEGATYDPDSGAVLLVGQPAETYGPYDLDDLMVVLRAKLFHLEPLGMTIDPDPADMHGPKQIIRFFAGCENTACGWVMFECDRLMKCYSQGKDNITGELMDPGIKGFGSMLQRAVASGREPSPDRWDRFWLDADIHDHKQGEQPTTSNGTQPVAYVTSDGSSMSLFQARIYLRTQRMKPVEGKLVTAEGEKNPDAEQFAIHFCNEFEQFAKLHPEFAQLEAISHLNALCDWMIQQHVPLDVDYIASYRQRIPVQTPIWTPTVTSELNVAMTEHGKTGVHVYKGSGGVSLSARVFLAKDDGTARKLGDAARKGQADHLKDVAWRQQDEAGVARWIIAMPTMRTRFGGVNAAVARSELRSPLGRPSSPVADLPHRPTLADSERTVLVPNTQISIAGLKNQRQQPRGPPDTVIFGDERHFAVADRLKDVPRVDVPLVASRTESDPNLFSRPPDPKSINWPQGLPPEPYFQARSDRSVPLNSAVQIPLISDVAAQPYAPRPPPDQFSAVAERTPFNSRQPVPLSRRSEIRQLSLAIFETSSGTRTLNFPKLLTWNNPAEESRMSIQGVPGSEIVVAEQLALISETGDIMIPFGQPEIDQEKGQHYYPTEPPNQHGIRGYYPLSSTVAFIDGARIKLNASGSPEMVTTATGTTVEFHYSSIRRAGRGQAWPVVEKCIVVAQTAEAQSGEYMLLAAPGQLASQDRESADGGIEIPGDDSTATKSTSNLNSRQNKDNGGPDSVASTIDGAVVVPNSGVNSSHPRLVAESTIAAVPLQQDDPGTSESNTLAGILIIVSIVVAALLVFMFFNNNSVSNPARNLATDRETDIWGSGSDSIDSGFE